MKDDFRFEYGVPWNNFRGVCRVRIYPRGTGTKVIICSRLPENTGPSITNAAEHIATQLCMEEMLRPGHMLWIEHYPIEGRGSLDETFDLVTFSWNYGNQAHHPSWVRVDRDWVERLIRSELDDPRKESR